MNHLKYLKYKSKYLTLKNQFGGNWFCPICYTENIDSNNLCSKCNKKKTQDDLSFEIQKKSNSNWKCKLCTFNNTKNENVCEICGSKRSSAAAEEKSYEGIGNSTLAAVKKESHKDTRGSAAAEDKEVIHDDFRSTSDIYYIYTTGLPYDGVLDKIWMESTLPKLLRELKSPPIRQLIIEHYDSEDLHNYMPTVIESDESKSTPNIKITSKFIIGILDATQLKNPNILFDHGHQIGYYPDGLKISKKLLEMYGRKSDSVGLTIPNLQSLYPGYLPNSYLDITSLFYIDESNKLVTYIDRLYKRSFIQNPADSDQFIFEGTSLFSTANGLVFDSNYPTEILDKIRRYIILGLYKHYKTKASDFDKFNSTFRNKEIKREIYLKILEKIMRTDEPLKQILDDIVKEYIPFIEMI